jgi:hypothetical protein
MSKHHGNTISGLDRSNPEVKLPVQVANQTEPVTKTPETPKTLFVVSSIDDLIAQVEKAGGTLSPEAKAELEKMRTAQETLEAPKRLSDAEAEVNLEVPKVFSAIAEKHKVSFAGRKVVIVFKASPKEGEPNPLVSFGPEVEVVASKKRSGNGGKGFKSHGEVVFHVEAGKEIHYGSFGAMAKELGWKMEGRANATVAITNPCTQSAWEAMDSDERKNLAQLFEVKPTEDNGKVTQHVYPVKAK